MKERAYWKKWNKRTDKISGALDDAIGISDLINRQTTPKKPPTKKKSRRKRQVTIMIDGKQYQATIRGTKQQPKKKKPKVTNSIPSWI